MTSLLSCLAACVVLAVQASAALAQGGVTGNISRSISEAISANVARGIVYPKLAYRNLPGAVQWMALAADGRTLAVVLSDNTVRLWDLELGVQRPPIVASAGVVAVALSADGTRLAVAERSGKVRVVDALDGRELASAALGAPATALAWWPRGDRLALLGADGALSLWAPEAGPPRKLANAGAQPTALAIGPGEELAVGDASGKVTLADAAAGTTRPGFAFGAPITSVAYDPANRSWLVGGDKGLLARAGQQLAGTRTGDVVADLDPATATALLRRGDDRLILVDLANGAVRTEAKFDGAKIVGAKIGQGAKFLLAGEASGIVRLWDVKQARPIVQLVSTTAGWTVIDVQGRFDGSQTGMESISWSAKGFDLTLDRFAKRFFEPGLLALYYAEQSAKLAKVPGEPEKGVSAPPKVELEIESREVEAGKEIAPLVVAEDMGGGIGDLRLYHNGKLVDPGALIQQQEVKQGGRTLRVQAYRVTPVPGINTLRAVGAGKWDVEGASPRETFVAKGETRRGTLHLISIGISTYAAPELKLDYSVRDADAVTSRLTAGARALVDRVEVRRLADREATRKGILDELARLKGARPEDIVVVYLAGHGVATEEDWLFLPYDVPYLRDVRQYAPHALKATDLEAALVGSPAQRVLLAIDACYSGGGLIAFEERQDFHRRLFRDLSKSAGITVLAATRWDQSAAELHALGHGVFTYVTLSGLDGRAALAQANLVTAHELTGFVGRNLPPLSRRYLKEAQEVSAFTLGADFPLVQAR